ncbi:MAG: response regulator [Micavibrio sp.]|nr:response regulator [Micavibrio sp.]
MPVDENMPILLVDDSKAMLAIIENLLNQIGFTNIDQASDAPSTLDMLRKKSYGLMLCDWDMDKTNGLDLLKVIRAAGANRDVPFILLTPETRQQGIPAAIRAGASACILKPFTVQKLKEVIANVLLPKNDGEGI